MRASLNLGFFSDDARFYSNLLGVRYTFDNDDARQGLGSGASAFSIYWDTSGYLGKGFDGFVSLMWTFYGDKVNGVTPGEEDTGWIGFRHKCLLNDKLDTNVKLNWQTKYSTRIEEGYNIVDATIEFQSDELLKNLPFKAGIKLPLWDSSDVQNEFGFFVGIGGTF